MFASPFSANVLVVDDDIAVVRALNVILFREGFNPIGCTTAAEALRKSDPSIGAAVLDIHLPDMSGLILSHQLRETLGPVPPIIILSGDNSMDNIKALPNAGATYFLGKPVNTGLLVQKLRELLVSDHR